MLTFLVGSVSSVNAFTPMHLNNHMSSSPNQHVALKATEEVETTAVMEVTSNDDSSSSSSSTAVLAAVEVNDEDVTYIMSEAMPWMVKQNNLEGYIGDVGFDPFGFSDRYEMEYLREAELKHGRIGMLAWLGWVSVDAGLRVFPEWNDVNVLDAHDQFSGWYGPMGALFYCLGLYEVFQMREVGKMRVAEYGPADRAAGDMNWDFLKILKGKSEAEVNRMKLRELKHARLGMLAFSGVVVQDAMVGANTFPYLELVTTPPVPL